MFKPIDDMKHCTFQAGILSCIISTNDPVKHTLFFNLFTAADFTYQNQKLFKDVKAAYDYDGHTDMISVWNIINPASKDDDETFKRFIHLSEVAGYLVSDCLFMHYAKRLHFEIKRREIKSLAAGLQMDADEVIDLKAVLDEFNDRVRQIRFEIEQNKPISVGDSISKTMSILEDEKSGKITHIYTGIFPLDDNMAGLRPGNIYVIASRPGVGKSAMAINICNNIASQNKAVLFVSLEMLSEEIDKRLICLRSWMDSKEGIEGYKFQKPKYLTASDFAKMSAESEKIALLPIKYAFQECNTPDAIEAAYKQEVDSGAEIRLIIIDHLNLMKHSNRNESRRLELTEISRDLKLLSMKYKIPIILLHQLNRLLEHRAAKEKAPTLADLREFGGLEEDASHVSLLWQPDEKLDGIELVIPKNRHGKKGIVKLDFFKEKMLIKEEPGYEPQR